MPNALDSFDKEIAPLGLYACDDLSVKSLSPQGYEWSRCLSPFLQKQSCQAVGKELFDGKTSFETPQIGFTQLQIVRLSKNKESPPQATEYLNEV